MAVEENPARSFRCDPSNIMLQAGILDRFVRPPAIPGGTKHIQLSNYIAVVSKQCNQGSIKLIAKQDIGLI